jgi:DtxR family Mn-dependent transcriptional regulator
MDPVAALGIGLLALLGLAAIFWPRYGLWFRFRRAREFTARVYTEDALKHFYKAELEGVRPTLQSLAGALQVTLNRAADVVERLQSCELLLVAGDEMSLSPSGRRYALNIIRAHRLWEQHLAEETGVEETMWHREAERQEHRISPEEADRLAAQLGHPMFDPHGDPIPTKEGELRTPAGEPLAAVEPNHWARIVHIEDEPESVYAQIRALGLSAGMLVRLLESSPQRIRLWVDGDEHVLAPVVASNIGVRPVTQTAAEEGEDYKSLSRLRPGDRATVQRISPRCRGAERRRLLDLGILPGTEVGAEMTSLGGGLTAYRVRDALIALRREQADLIQVRAGETA